MDSNLATVALTITGVNDAPVAGDDAYTMDEDATLTIPALGVLTNDSDVDGDPLTTSLVSGPASGSLTFSGDGSFVYTPSANFNGTDSFTYRASDGVAASNIASISITVRPVNDVPTTSGIANVTVEEDAPDTVINLFPAFEDVEDSDLALTYTVANSTQPTLFTSTAINGGAGALTLDYAPDAYGSADITLRATDTEGAFVETTFTVTVNAVNDSPVANPYTAVTPEDTPITLSASMLLSSDTDVEGDVLSLTGVSNAVNGTVALNNDGNPVFTPVLDFNGTATFDYTISDGNGGIGYINRGDHRQPGQRRPRGGQRRLHH